MDLTYLYAAAIIGVGVLLALVTRVVVGWLKVRAAETDTLLDDILIVAIGTPVQVAIVVIATYCAISQFGFLPAEWKWLLDSRYITVFYIILATCILSSFVHTMMTTYGQRLLSSWDDRLVKLLNGISKYLLWFIALILILSIFEVNVTPFLAGAGIAGMAVALAAQDILSNFLGGAIITLDKPFKVGDRIQIDQYYGDVISIGPRSTRLKTLDYQIVVFPNNKIITNIIINYTEPDQKIRIAIPVSVAYGSDLKKVKRVLLNITHTITTSQTAGVLLQDPAPKVFFLEFQDHSLMFILYVWARKYNLSDEVKDAINIQIAEQFAAEGIEIPFPHIDIQIKGASGVACGSY